MKWLGQSFGKLHQFGFDHKKGYDWLYSYSSYCNMKNLTSRVFVVNNDSSNIQCSNTNEMSSDNVGYLTDNYHFVDISSESLETKISA